MTATGRFITGAKRYPGRNVSTVESYRAGFMLPGVFVIVHDIVERAKDDRDGDDREQQCLPSNEAISVTL